MGDPLIILIVSAIGISLLHTLFGPDHYIPFIALSKSRNWNWRKTIRWTILCGLGHVGSSVLLGLCGASLGWNLERIFKIENIRGGLAGWAFIVFGLGYMIWGILNSLKNKSHKHFETDAEGNMVVFEHQHGSINKPIQKHSVTPWVMFIIFLLGPCEPMIPLLFAPALKHSFSGMAILILTYTFFTITTMIIMVSIGLKGIAFNNTKTLEKNMHTIAGLTILICGVGMIFFNW
jgi:sulfite exporter TauE/SafE